MQSLIPESSPPLRLLMVGLNHRTAPLALRETVGFTGAQAALADEQFRRRFPRAQVVILSTCNRVEFYIARPLAAEPTLEHLAQFLAEFHALPVDQLHGHLYHKEDRAMVEHLFAVTSSLDSMVVGETQILSQVKQAYQQARLAGSTGVETAASGNPEKAVLHVLFQRALSAAKEVHEKTRLSAGRVSIASVAVDLATSVFDRFEDKTVVCVGAGKMAALMLRHLADLHPRRVMVTNRSAARGAALAAEFSAEHRPFEQLDALLVEADILLTSTGSAHALITEERFKGLIKARRYRPIVMVDIAVPRDIEPAVAALPNVYLYNVDDLQEVAAGNQGKRDEAIAAAQGVVQAHVEDFLKWLASRDIGPLVKALYERSHAMAKTELEIYFARSPELTAEQRAELERMTHRLIGKLLHAPVTQLTTRAEATARPMLAAAIRKLFELEGGAVQPDDAKSPE